MKRKLVQLLAWMLCLLFAVPALAASTSGQGEEVARNLELAAYIDGDGNAYLTGYSDPINKTPLASILSIDTSRAIALTAADESTGARKLLRIDLSTFEESTLSEDVFAACVTAQDQIYSISSADRTKLMRCDMESGAWALAYSSTEFMQSVYESSNGLVIRFADGAGAVAYDAQTDSFEPFAGELASENLLYGDGEVYLTDAGSLYVQVSGDNLPQMVDTGVLTWEKLGDKLYYLVDTDGMARLKEYDVTTMGWRIVSTPDTAITYQLTSSADALFLLGTNDVIYQVNTENGEITPFQQISRSQITVEDGWAISSLNIKGMSGQINVYAVLQQEAADDQTFSFADESATDAVATEKTVLVQTYPVSGEKNSSDVLKPTATYAPLRFGSRGDAVKALQEKLIALGYLSGNADGIFGSQTQRAVKLLQSDLGLTVNGIADEDLQKRVLEGNVAAYDPYLPLSKGNKGLRVQMMQDRLRELGYLADSADGVYGARTQAAVALFQAENSLSSSGNADRNTLVTLYADYAKKCSSYIDLQKGDTGYRVRELNKRLKDLYYLEGTAGSTYNNATVAAVKKFQDQAGLTQTGVATVTVQKQLFAKSAPEYDGYVELKRGDENGRVKELQNRLKELEFFSGKVMNSTTIIRKFWTTLLSNLIIQGRSNTQPVRFPMTT